MLSTKAIRISLSLFCLLIGSARCLAGALVSDSAAERVGLERVWFTQAPIDAARSHVVGASHTDDMVCVLSSACVLQAIDAKTGTTLWSTRVGTPGLHTLGPTIHEDLITLINGSTLFLLDAKTGRELFSRRLRGGPGSAPSLYIERSSKPSDQEFTTLKRTVHIYVPLITGRMISIMIAQDSLGEWGIARRGTWNYNSNGSVFDKPQIIGDRVIWATSRGRLYGAYANGKGAAYRFTVQDHIVAPVTASDELVFFASQGGYVYGLEATRGDQAWRSTVGSEVVHPAVFLDEVVYVGTQEPALYALDAKTGAIQWRAEGINQFIMANNDTVYARGSLGLFAKINTKSGSIEAWPTNQENPELLANSTTGSIYLISTDGLVQCFRELKPAGVIEQELETPPLTELVEDKEPAEEDNPFVAESPFETDDPQDESPVADSDDGGFSDDSDSDDEDPFDDPFDF